MYLLMLVGSQTASIGELSFRFRAQSAAGPCRRIATWASVCKCAHSDPPDMLGLQQQNSPLGAGIKTLIR